MPRMQSVHPARRTLRKKDHYYKTGPILTREIRQIPKRSTTRRPPTTRIIMSWTIHHEKKTPIKNPVVLIGMPGIGNIGKIVLDFIIDDLKAHKIAEFHGTGLPHSVFVNEDNLVELPSIEVWTKRIKNKHYLFITGDVQPINEEHCYQFCELLMTQLKKWHSRLVITIGGIALKEEPESPNVYITGTTHNAIHSFARGINVKKDIHGVVGPIIGITGVALGIADRHDIPAVSLLTETLGHPMYVGITGAKQILKIIKKKIGLPIKLKQLDKEIEKIEAEITRKTQEINKLMQAKEEESTKYIG